MTNTKRYTTEDGLYWTYRGPTVYAFRSDFEDPEITNATTKIIEHGIDFLGNLGNCFY